MKKTFICSLLAVSMLTACATDPYTGESKVSKTAWGTESERWPAVKKAL